MFKKLLQDQSGATAIEYTLIAAAMAAVLILVMPKLTAAISGQFGTITAAISSGK